ncbi:MAG: hypothetical protein NTW62_02510 [Candidatus Nomurabacteria bacterium]|nr:hypothetical protein [Candidatus Nomurabacteria bacterium]
MKKNIKNYFKYVTGFIFCFLLRLIPFRPPNVEPILATAMPFSKEYGKLAGFFFGFFSIILYDVATARVGMWTLITGVAYGVLGLVAAVYFENKNNTSWNYAKFAILATIFYDAVTGLTVGPIFFHQSFMTALAGQIPFTLLHLVSNVGFAIVFSPLIYRYVIENKKFELSLSKLILNPKQI